MPTPQPGDRIRLVATLDGPDPIPPGTTGTVAAVRQQRTWAQVDVVWDNGRPVPPDRFQLIHGEVRNGTSAGLADRV
jgi:hypothetical protein